MIVRKNAERIPIGPEAFSTTLIWSYWLVNVAAGGVSDDEFYLYDLETGKLVAEKAVEDQVVIGFQMSPDGRFFAVALVNDWNSSSGGGIDIYSSKGRKVYSWEDSQSLRIQDLP